MSREYAGRCPECGAREWDGRRCMACGYDREGFGPLFAEPEAALTPAAPFVPPVAWTDPPPPTGTVDTSVEAAGAIRPVVSGLRWRVLCAIVDAPDGLTCEEACERTQMEANTIRPRLWELEGKNRRAPLPRLVAMTDGCRLNASGSRAHIYRPTDAGRALVAERREQDPE